MDHPSPELKGWPQLAAQSLVGLVPELLVVRGRIIVYGADWLAFVAGLERRPNAGATPVESLITR